MTEMVELFKLSYYSYRGGKKLHQICSATWIYRTVFELKNILASIPMVCIHTCAQCSRMHLWQIFFFGLHAYFWKIQVILWCSNPFLEFIYYIDYGFLASYFWHFFLPFCNFYYWKVTNLALIEKKELCRQVWDLF